MPTTSEVGENIWVTSTRNRNAVRPMNLNRAVKYAAGIATASTIRVDTPATISEVLSQLRNRPSPSTSLNVENCQCRGRNLGGVDSTSALGRSASSNITAYGARNTAAISSP